mgnify:CR=1 FL=1|jgi:hypothetical protein
MDKMNINDFYKLDPSDPNKERMVLNYLAVDFLITDFQRHMMHWVSNFASERYQWSTQQAMCFKPIYNLLELVENIGPEKSYNFLMGVKGRIEYPISKAFSMRQTDLVIGYPLGEVDEEGEKR